MDKEKKMAAALAAVTLLLKEEEAMVSKHKKRRAPKFNLWGVAGRQARMGAKRLVYLKALRRPCK